MKRIFICASAAVYLFAVFPLTAEVTSSSDVTSVTVVQSKPAVQAVTADLAVESALRWNSTVQRSSLSVEALKRKAESSYNIFIPSVSAGASFSAGRESAVSSGKTASGSISASLSVSPSSIKSAQKKILQYQDGVQEHESALRSLELSVRKSFYLIQYEKEYVSLLELSLETAQKQYEQALSKYKTGLVSEADLLSAHVNVENIKPDLESAKITLANDIDAFIQMTGLTDADADDFYGPLEQTAQNAVASAHNFEKAAAASSSSASVDSLRRQLEQAKLDESITVSNSYHPSLSLSYSFLPSADTADDLLSADSWSDNGSFSVSLKMPLDSFLPFSQAAENVRSAHDTVRDTELQLSQAEEEDSLAKNRLVRTIQQSISALSARQANVELAERQYDLTSEAYRRGTKDVMAVQDAAESVQKARVSLLQEQYTLTAAVLDFENQLNVPFGSLGEKK